MDRDEVEARLCEILRDFEGVVSLYLFGSFAEGRQHSESDIDVGILLDREQYPDEGLRFEQRLLLSAALSFVNGPKADVVILNDAPATLGRAIVTRGKRLVCLDEEKDRSFVRDVQLQAVDLVSRRDCDLSCDPLSFSRDANRLIASGWRLATLDLLDLFPNTHHVETLASFERAQ